MITPSSKKSDWRNAGPGAGETTSLGSRQRGRGLLVAEQTRLLFTHYRAGLGGTLAVAIAMSLLFFDQVPFPTLAGVELPVARAAALATSAHLDWGTPTAVAELATATHRYVLTLTAYLP